jgi:hypothetical protein
VREQQTNPLLRVERYERSFWKDVLAETFKPHEVDSLGVQPSQLEHALSSSSSVILHEAVDPRVSAFTHNSRLLRLGIHSLHFYVFLNNNNLNKTIIMLPLNLVLVDSVAIEEYGTKCMNQSDNVYIWITY